VTEQSIWDMVVGHDEAVAVLKEALAGERVTHAWLFTGPPGIGKLHTARVFAAALNCPAGGDGTCDTCRRILRGVHPDVHLIVPEGDNLLVEDVRAVREEASRTHHEARTAVFILDEADRLTEAAANALLKVLEEPPPEVVFVLVARSPEALVDTVPSRARTLPFVSLSLAELTAALGLPERLASGQPSDALAAAATVVAIADEVAAAARSRQERELAELDEAFGTGRGTGALRKRLETRHRRELRRVRFDAIRDSLADLLGAYRDIALLSGEPTTGGGSSPAGEEGGSEPGAEASLGDGKRGGSGPGGEVSIGDAEGGGSGPGGGWDAGGAPLVHPDKAGSFGRLAARIDPASALCAAGALEEADRRLAIGAAPLLTLEAAFLSAQAALRGAAVPINRLAIRR
jgi:DNA polymerase III subunit delta'